MKYSKTNSLRTQRVIAQYGKSARYPLCQTAIGLWRLIDEIHKYAKKALSLGELLVSAKRQKEQTRALYEQIYKEGKHKEAIEAAALVLKVDDFFKKTHSAYEANANLFEIFSEVLFPVAVAQFESECDAVLRAKDTKAVQAFERVKQRWRANPSGKGARRRAGDQREHEILKMLRDKGVKAAWATKDGVGAGYLEALRGGDRPLSDEAWQGRLTVREIHSRLMTVGGASLAGDKDGKEIRRILTRLGIRPAEDQRGRKWKPPLPKKQEPKRPRGARPRKVKFHEDFTVVETEHPAAGDEDGSELSPHPTPYVPPSSFELFDSREAGCDLAAIEREIARLRKKRGCALPRNLGKARKPEGQTKGRSNQFAAFLDSK